MFFCSIWSAITESTLSFSDNANSLCIIYSAIYACLFSYLSALALSSLSMISFYTISSPDRSLNASNCLASFLKLSFAYCNSLSFLLYVSSFFCVSTYKACTSPRLFSISISLKSALSTASSRFSHSLQSLDSLSAT
jgi:hypothetical protein